MHFSQIKLAALAAIATSMVSASVIPTKASLHDESPTVVKRAGPSGPVFTWAAEDYAPCIFRANNIAKEFAPILAPNDIHSLFYTAGTEANTAELKAQDPRSKLMTIQDVWAANEARGGQYGENWWQDCITRGKGQWSEDGMRKAYNELSSAAFASVSKGDIGVIIPHNFNPNPSKPGQPWKTIWMRVEFPSLDAKKIRSITAFKVNPGGKKFSEVYQINKNANHGNVRL